MSTDVVALYRASRDRILDLARDLSEDDVRRPVATCPDWTVHELIAHLVGVASDFATGTMDGAPGAAWTEAQVAPRRDLPTARLLDEWTEAAPQFDAALGGLPPGLGTIAVADVVNHEHDLRHAIGRPGAQDDPAVGVSLQFMSRALGRRITEAGLPTLRLVTPEGDELVAGKAEPAGSVTAPRFELFRAVAGRRSRAQVTDFDWTTDPAAYAEVWPMFGVYAERDIVE